MNHDITHCNGTNCDRRGTCERYEAHLDLLKPRNVAEEPIGRFNSYTDSNDCVED